MPDITMCKGVGCNKRNTCFRFIAEPSNFLQSWFSISPNEKNGNCEYYMPEKQKDYDVPNMLLRVFEP